MLEGGLCWCMYEWEFRESGRIERERAGEWESESVLFGTARARLISHKELNARFIVYLVFVLCRGIKIKFSVIFRSRYTASLLSVFFFSVGLNSQTVLRRRSGSCTVL